MSTTFLEKLLKTHADNKVVHGLLSDIIILKTQKLYHQLSDKILSLIVQPEFKEGDELIQMYKVFLKDLEVRLKPLKMAEILVLVSSQFKSVKDGVQFLTDKGKNIMNVSKPAKCLITSVIALLYVFDNQLEKAKTLIEECSVVIDNQLGLDSIVFSRYYQVVSVYYKELLRAGDFYKSALLYLAYTPLDGINSSSRVDLARDLVLASLVSSHVYNVGELLQHNIINSLRGGELSWLVELLEHFNSGNITLFRQVLESNKDSVKTKKLLIDNIDFVCQKVSILALIELVWNKPSCRCQLSFSEIKDSGKLDKNSDVEILVMKALSLGLIQGSIDQPKGVVNITSVKPRILSESQIKTLATKIKGWATAVNNTTQQFQANSKELFV